MKKLLLLALAIVPLYQLASIGISSMQEHERLRFRNDFKTPAEVVNYYCARDASGFVWSGLLETERKNFTLWKEVPQHESFYVAKRYEILPVPQRSQDPDSATVEVRYEIMGVGDAHGALMPSKEPSYKVVFELKRVKGQWKITSPEPPAVSPVVLASKFPVANWGQ